MDDLRRLARGMRDVTFDGDTIVVRLARDRIQRIAIDDSAGDVLRLHSMVARARDLADVRSPEGWAWRRNRTSSLVGFRIDIRGRLLAEAWMPREGLTADEFRETVRTLAAEADRVEYLLTGDDVE
jgi:hypothetical protein